MSQVSKLPKGTFRGISLWSHPCMGNLRTASWLRRFQSFTGPSEIAVAETLGHGPKAAAGKSQRRNGVLSTPVREEPVADGHQHAARRPLPRGEPPVPPHVRVRTERGGRAIVAGPRSVGRSAAAAGARRAPPGTRDNPRPRGPSPHESGGPTSGAQVGAIPRPVKPTDGHPPPRRLHGVRGGQRSEERR